MFVFLKVCFVFLHRNEWNLFRAFTLDFLFRDFKKKNKIKLSKNFLLNSGFKKVAFTFYPDLRLNSKINSINDQFINED